MNNIGIEDYIIKDKAISRYTSMGVGGPADYLLEAHNLDLLIMGVKWATKNTIPYQIIGRGTNVIVGDSGFRGLIIINRTTGLNFDINESKVIVESGYPLAKLILDSAEHNLGGMESLFGIPGSIGGAVVVNAGTHGVMTGSFIKKASVLENGTKIVSVGPDWFNFQYRQSKLKKQKQKHPLVLLNFIMQLQKKKRDQIMDEIKISKQYREKNQPLGEVTAGSIFKNPSLSDAQTNVKEKSAGYLLEQSGAKLLAVDGAKVSKKHANWIINSGNAPASAMRELIDKMRRAVEEKFSVTLEEEVEYIGDWNEKNKQ